MRPTRMNLRVAVLALATAVLTATAEGGPLFRAPFRAYSGSSPGLQVIALADFNGDGRLDVAAGGWSSGTLNIFLNDGAGGLRLGSSLPSGARAIAAFDMNRDGFQDLVIANGDVFVYLGHGDGSFTLADQRAAGSEPGGVVIGDLNGDGIADVVVTNTDDFSGRSVTAFLGKGDGTLSDGITSVIENTSASDLALADFDEDGRLDLVAGDAYGTFAYLMRGLVNGRFGPIEGFDIAYPPEIVAVGDLNEDGHQDVVAGGHLGGAVGVCLGRGDGTFAYRVLIPAPGASFVGLADVNRDGHLDIVTGSAVLKGDGHGNFSPPIPFVTEGNASDVATGDLDGDGVPDLVTAHPYFGRLAVLTGNGDGSFGKSVPVPTAAYPVGLASGDVDGDGFKDVAVASNQGPVTILFGDGAGGFPRQIQPPGLSANSLVLDDLDHDGALDMVTLNSGTVSARLGDGHGAFGPAHDYAVGSGAHSIASGDFDGDGHVDVVTANFGRYDYSNPRSPIFLPDSTATVLFGAGDGTFARRLDLRTGLAPAVVLVADVNHDGHMDVLTANSTSSTVSLLLGNGDGSFRPAVDAPTDANPISMALGDFDADGRVDVVTANGGQSITFLTIDAAGSIHRVRDIPGLGLLQWIGAGDWNGDGVSDLAFTQQASNSVRILLGPEDNVSSSEFYGSGAGAGFGLVTDLNHDGRPDLVVANTDGASVTALVNIASAALSVGPPPAPKLAFASGFRLGGRTVAVTLESSEPALLEVFDLAGRRVARRALVQLGPGKHEVGLPESSAWRSGVYFARLVQGARSARTKWVVLD